MMRTRRVAAAGSLVIKKKVQGRDGRNKRLYFLKSSFNYFLQNHYHLVLVPLTAEVWSSMHASLAC